MLRIKDKISLEKVVSPRYEPTLYVKAKGLVLHEVKTPVKRNSVCGRLRTAALDHICLQKYLVIWESSYQ